MSSLLIPAATATVTTLALTPIVRRLAFQRGYLDVPNDRSSHDRPTPKTGGYAMLAGLMVGVWSACAWRDKTVAVVLGGALLLAGVALVDERRALPRPLRLILQIAVAGLVVWGLGQATGPAGPAAPALPWVAWTVALVWIVGLVNTYNFMDGLNGIAGVAAVVSGSALAMLAVRRGDLAAAALATSAAAAAAGFLPFNLPRGSIFMGDSGSTAFGLIFGALVLDAGELTVVPVAAALPVAPFVLDAGATVVRRAFRGERFWTPHRSHYYQRLQQQGWSHLAVAGLYGALTAACATVALAFDRLSLGQQAVALAAIVIGHAVVFARVQAGWSRQARHRSGLAIDGEPR